MHSAGDQFTDWSDPTFCQSTLDALAASVAILDPRGAILAVNDAWAAFVIANDFPIPDYGVGVNYLTVFRVLSSARDRTVVAAGFRALLAGRPGPFRHEFRYRIARHMAVDALWARLSAVRAGPPAAPFVIVSHEDISMRRSAQEALHEATARLLHAEDEERRRIARDLHDSTAQYLTGARLMLKGLGSADAAKAAVVKDELGYLISSALNEIRSLSFLLHPPALEHLGLAAAVREFTAGMARRAGLAIVLDIAPNFPRLAPAAEIALYRVSQEALANVQRHSGSPRVTVSLKLEDGTVRLSVRDYGLGLPAEPSLKSGVGLEGMRLRLRHLNGRLLLHDARPGLELEALVPYRAPAKL